MSKELVFESEKLEKKQKIKRILIPLVILAVILAAVVVIALIKGKKQAPRYTGGEDTLYPYSWTENKDGSILFSLPLPKEEGYAWVPDLSVSGVADVTKADTEEKDTVGWLIRPLESGRTELGFHVADPAAETDRIYSLELLLQVSREDESLKVSILNGSSRTLPGIVRGGEAEGFPYQIALASDRRILLSLRDGSPIREYDPMDQETAAPPEGMTFPETSASETEAAQAAVVNNNWECVSSREDIVRVNSVYSADRQISAQLELLYETGSSEIRLYCDGIGMALVFTVTVEENGSVSIPSHRLESYEPPVYETDEFIDDGTLIITIPAGEGTP